jgi:PDZ domain-containing protein
VGPIGGLPQKASAVAQRGIDLFLIPAAQSTADVEAARTAAPGLQIVPVADVFEALDALVAAGGDPVDIAVRSIRS